MALASPGFHIFVLKEPGKNTYINSRFETTTRNFLGGFFHSFLDFFLFWFNVHSFAAWQARQPLMTRSYKPEFYSESRNPNRTLNFITKPEFASLTCSLT
jgi:hypothetical protein